MKICAYQSMASVQNCSLLQKDSTDDQTDSMLVSTGSRRMRPAQTWWVGRSWRADRVVRNRERICRIARHLAEGEDGEIGEEQAARNTQLRPRRDKAPMLIAAGPLHRH
jgi:hypothetical protein